MSSSLLHRVPRLAIRQDDSVRLLGTLGRRLLAILAAAGVVLLGMGVNDYWLLVLTGYAVVLTAASGLQMLTGVTGQFSLGHAAFLAVGFYTAVVLSGGVWPWLDTFLGSLPGWLQPVFGNAEGWPLIPGLLLAGGAATVLGLFVGPAALRLKGIYLAITTMGLVFLVGHVLLNWEAVTGGPQGISYTSPSLFGSSLGDDSMSMLWLTAERKQYLVVCLVAAVALLMLTNLKRTRAGRALQAVRDRDVAAAMAGVPVARYKLRAFAVSSFLTGVAGALMGMVVPYAVPYSWDLMLSIKFVAIIIIGGAGPLGVILGAAFVELLPPLVLELGIEVGGASPFQLQELVYGAAIIAFLVFEQGGLRGLWDRLARLVRRWPMR